MEDGRLVARVRQGDEAAFAALFERHKASVYRYALHMRARDAAAAEDIVQEVFLAFLRQLGQFDAARGNVASYLLGIARRQVLRAVDRAHGDESLDGIDCPSPEPDPLAGLTRSETIERVRAAIADLPPVFREAIVLCELNELDYTDAAAVVGCPIGTIRSRLHRARALLMKALDGPWQKSRIA